MEGLLLFCLWQTWQTNFRKKIEEWKRAFYRYLPNYLWKLRKNVLFIGGDHGRPVDFYPWMSIESMKKVCRKSNTDRKFCGGIQLMERKAYCSSVNSKHVKGLQKGNSGTERSFLSIKKNYLWKLRIGVRSSTHRRP